ncbi:MAG: hypothetical protein EA424_05390 [Planctomycetaceae bacterium]|nr:MAG: hypothetical protein EA424_05390 [Planctomycetaceae bacterium]
MSDFGELFCTVAGRPDRVDAMRSPQTHRRFHLRRRARELFSMSRKLSWPIFFVLPQQNPPINDLAGCLLRAALFRSGVLAVQQQAHRFDKPLGRLPSNEIPADPL